MTTRRSMALMLMRACAGAAFGLLRPSNAQGQGDDGGLLRLWSVLQKQLARRKDALPLPWRESIVTPSTARVVWYARSLSMRAGGDSFRVGFDPTTRWYFVAQAPAGGLMPRFFGPLEEDGKGVFVETFAPPSRQARPVARKPTHP